MMQCILEVSSTTGDENPLHYHMHPNSCGCSLLITDYNLQVITHLVKIRTLC